MSFSTLTPVPDDGRMDASRPRFGGPTRRRSFTPAQKLDHVAAYEAALTQGGGGAYLRQQGLYSSQITEWRRLRDARVLAGKPAGAKIGRPTAQQAEIARLRRQLDLTQRRLSTSEAALDIMGKKDTRSWRRSPRARRISPSPRGVDGHRPRPSGCRGHDQGGGGVDRPVSGNSGQEAGHTAARDPRGAREPAQLR